VIKTTLPGMPSHQAVLGALTAHYAGDPRVLAFSLFGSLARGDWDEYSDLDLDVVLRDDAPIDARQEVERLVPVLEAVGERITLIVPRTQGSVELVLLPLLEISLRYHSLATTSPNIVESVIVLAGSLTIEQVRAAGLVNMERDETPPAELLDACVRYALEIDIALRRGESWLAIELLHRTRNLLMELFAQTHGGARPVQTFDAQADSGSVRLSQTQAAPIRAKADSGGVSVRLAKNAGYNLSVEADSGNISVPEMTVKSGFSSHHIQGQVGSGGPPVEIRVSSGNVSVQ